MMSSIIFVLILVSILFTMNSISNAESFDFRGKLSQVELALKATRKKSTIFAAKKDDNICIVIYSPIVDKKRYLYQYSGITQISEGLFSTGVGITSDLQFLLQKVFEFDNQHRVRFDNSMSVSRLSKALSSFIHQHTLLLGVRPFGASIFLFGRDEENQLILHDIDPLGNSRNCEVACIGANSESIIKQWHKLTDLSGVLSFDETNNDDNNSKTTTDKQLPDLCFRCISDALVELGIEFTVNDLRLFTYRSGEGLIEVNTSKYK